MDLIKINGIILKKKDIGEADVLVRIFTKEYGKISALSYGIRKSKKRNIITCSPLSVVEATLKKNGDYYTIVEIDLIKNYKKIIKDIEKLEISLYILSSIDKIYDFHFEENEFFSKITEIFDFIESLETFNREYKYYLILSFLRRIMLEQGIFEIYELKEKMGVELIEKYKEIGKIVNKNNDFLYIQKELTKYNVILKKLMLIFENYINENLQTKLEIKKFIMEDLYDI